MKHPAACSYRSKHTQHHARSLTGLRWTRAFQACSHCHRKLAVADSTQNAAVALTAIGPTQACVSLRAPVVLRCTCNRAAFTGVAPKTW
jgi:hypothetical protein